MSDPKMQQHVHAHRMKVTFSKMTAAVFQAFRMAYSWSSFKSWLKWNATTKVFGTAGGESGGLGG